ncbi:MAG: radical SAM protein [Planctomycetota bacterium]|nr:radical SAM protein [Planctomycetota bacterium]MCX8039279.1 radical SAM protein [Planctomycetota bacterium]
MNDLVRLHPRTWRQFRFAYPVISRRARGLSLGLNLNPDTVCNFDCAYCDVDRRQPPRETEVDEQALLAELAALLAMARDGAIWQEAPFDRTPPALRRLNDIAFSGDGEPTSYPRFPEVLAAVDALRQRQAPELPLVVITNATLFHRPAVRAALLSLALHDEIWAKLDAGSEDWYRRIDRSRIPFARVLGNLRELGRARALVIQSLWCRVAGQPPPRYEVASWVERLAWLQAEQARIARIQVYTISRPTAEPWVAALRDEELAAIADAARPLGIPVEIFTSGSAD